MLSIRVELYSSGHKKIKKHLFTFIDFKTDLKSYVIVTSSNFLLHKTFCLSCSSDIIYISKLFVLDMSFHLILKISQQYLQRHY